MENNKYNILFAEDEEELRRGVVLAYKKHGYYVQEASNGLKCAELITESEECGFMFDLLVIDIMMPEMTGLEVLKFIKNKGIKIPVLLITGYSDLKPDADLIENIELHMLNKPFNPAELIKATEKILHKTGASND